MSTISSAPFTELSIDGSAGDTLYQNDPPIPPDCPPNPNQNIINDAKIAACIISHFRSGDAGKEMSVRVGLLNAALACKGLLEAALDELWEHMDSLVPLFHVLPAFQISEGGLYVLNGPVTAEEWARLKYYAERIKIFTHEGSATDDIALSTYIRIAQLQPSEYLLPHLTNLSALRVNNHINHISLFCSTSLKSIKLANIETSYNHLVAPFLAAIAGSQNCLRTLTLKHGSLSITSFEPIVGFPQLRSLIISDAVHITDFSLLEVLGGLPELEDLVVEVTKSSYQRDIEDIEELDTMTQRGFHNLKSLTILGTFALIRDIVNYVGSPHLASCDVCPIVSLNATIRQKEEPAQSDELSIALSALKASTGKRSKGTTPVAVRFVMQYQDVGLDSKSSQDLDIVFSTISSRWSHSMRVIAFRQHDVDDSQLASLRKTIWLDANTFRSLSLITGLEVFEIRDWSISELDYIVQQCAPYWTEIASLQLPVNRAKLSMETLAMLAELCPRLEYLQASLELEAFYSLNSPFKPLHHQLRTLSIGSENVVSDTQQLRVKIARNINILFPFLEDILTHDGWSASRWKNIYELVELCQGVREDDRRRNL